MAANDSNILLGTIAYQIRTHLLAETKNHVTGHSFFASRSFKIISRFRIPESWKL